MTDLTVDQVRALLQAQGFTAPEEDLPEITYRLNAAQDALASLEHPDLDAVEPLPVFWLLKEPRG